jgi:hypothetical protein
VHSQHLGPQLFVAEGVVPKDLLSVIVGTIVAGTIRSLAGDGGGEREDENRGRDGDEAHGRSFRPSEWRRPER